MISREEYYPFGETSYGSYGKKRYRFCGKEKDEESGLYYYGMRYYSPWTCRFMSVDPLAPKYAHLAPYAYAANKPINEVDLDGLETTNETPTPTGDSTKTDSIGTGGSMPSDTLITGVKTDSSGVATDSVTVKPPAEKPKKTTETNKKLNTDNTQTLKLPDGTEVKIDISKLPKSLISDEKVTLNKVPSKAPTLKIKNEEGKVEKVPLMEQNKSFFYGDIEEKVPPKIKYFEETEQSGDNYAKQLIDSKRVTFDKAHVSGVDDKATAYQNIHDAAEGKLAQRSNYGNAPGGEVALSNKMLKALVELSKTYTFNISELSGASHSKNSKHYSGTGVDITKINGVRVTENNPYYKEFMKAAEALGATVTIGPPSKGHGTHVHLQF